MEWDDLRLVLAIADHGTLRRAARSLEVDVSTLSRRLNALETLLGARVFDRTPTGLMPTHAGSEMLDAARKVDLEVRSLSRRVAGRDLRVEGVVRITYPDVLSGLVPRALAGCTEAHPGLSLQLDSREERVDLARGDADLAVRVEARPAPDLIGLRIGRLGGAVYASSAYLAAHPEPIESDQHRWIDWGPAYAEKPALRHVAERFAARRVVGCGNSGRAVLEAVRAGLGVGVLPHEVARKDRCLSSVYELPDEATTPIWLLWHRDVRRVARVVVVAEWLKKSFVSA